MKDFQMGDFFMKKTMTFHRKKIWMVFLVCALMLLGLVGRLVYLMGVRSDYYYQKAEELHEAIGMLNAGVDFIFGAVKEEPACHCNDEEGAQRHQDVAAEEVHRIKNVLVHDLVISPRTHRES